MTTNPDYVVARSTYPPSPLEGKETDTFTMAAIWSGLPVEYASVVTTMYPAQFSRDEYGFSGDVIARLTRGTR